MSLSPDTPLARFRSTWIGMALALGLFALLLLIALFFLRGGDEDVSLEDPRSVYRLQTRERVMAAQEVQLNEEKMSQILSQAERDLVSSKPRRGALPVDPSAAPVPQAETPAAADSSQPAAPTQ